MPGLTGLADDGLDLGRGQQRAGIECLVRGDAALQRESGEHGHGDEQDAIEIGPLVTSNMTCFGRARNVRSEPE